MWKGFSLEVSKSFCEFDTMNKFKLSYQMHIEKFFDRLKKLSHFTIFLYHCWFHELNFKDWNENLNIVDNQLAVKTTFCVIYQKFFHLLLCLKFPIRFKKFLFEVI
jgi:hypothetical protein